MPEGIKINMLECRGERRGLVMVTSFQVLKLGEFVGVRIAVLLLPTSHPRNNMELSRRLAFAETLCSGASIRLRDPYSAF
jgi:hypothetical protein